MQSHGSSAFIHNQKKKRIQPLASSASCNPWESSNQPIRAEHFHKHFLVVTFLLLSPSFVPRTWSNVSFAFHFKHIFTLSTALKTTTIHCDTTATAGKRGGTGDYHVTYLTVQPLRCQVASASKPSGNQKLMVKMVVNTLGDSTYVLFPPDQRSNKQTTWFTARLLFFWFLLLRETSFSSDLVTQSPVSRLAC